MGRIKLTQPWPPFPKKEEVIEVQAEEINEESSFLGADDEIWGDNEHYEVENSLTRVAFIILLAFIFYLLLKTIFTKEGETN
jgi:hypothetical protein